MMFTQSSCSRDTSATTQTQTAQSCAHRSHSFARSFRRASASAASTSLTATTATTSSWSDGIGRRARTIAKAQEREEQTSETKRSKDPFGFDSGRNEGPVPIVPGFDTAEGGKVGPLGTFGISVLLIFLFGGSLFFTSVPRSSVEQMAREALVNDPDAPTNVLKR